MAACGGGAPPEPGRGRPDTALEGRDAQRQGCNPGILAVGGGRAQRSKQTHLDEQPGVDRLAQVHLGLGDELEETQPEPRGRDGREVGDERDFVGTDRRALGVAESDKLCGTRQARHIAKQLTRIGTGGEGSRRRAQGAGGVGAREGGDQRMEGRRVGEPE